MVLADFWVGEDACIFFAMQACRKCKGRQHFGRSIHFPRNKLLYPPCNAVFSDKLILRCDPCTYGVATHETGSIRVPWCLHLKAAHTTYAMSLEGDTGDGFWCRGSDSGKTQLRYPFGTQCRYVIWLRFLQCLGLGSTGRRSSTFSRIVARSSSSSRTASQTWGNL